MYNPYKTKYKYKCIRCGKTKISVDETRLTCPDCEKWTKAGIGQTDIFGNIIKE